MYIKMYIGEPVANRRSIADARTNLPGLVREAESGRAVELTRRGKPVAVMIGFREYERLTSAHRGFAEAYDEFRRGVDLESLDLDPGELFAETRDRNRGREIDF